MARNTDKKIDAVLDRVWLGVNTRSEEDELKQFFDDFYAKWAERRKLHKIKEISSVSTIIQFSSVASFSDDFVAKSVINPKNMPKKRLPGSCKIVKLST